MVKKLALLVVPLLVILMQAPLLIALIVAGIIAPAVVSTIACDQDEPVTATGGWRPPFQQRYTLTSPFGRRYHPVFKQWRLHTGQDLTSLPGAGPVVAASAGTVISARAEPIYGNIVTLRHSGGIRTRYGHLASIDAKIRSGATVTIGQKLGVEGSTGTSTGLHLHFQVEINGQSVDPVPFMAAHGATLGQEP